MTDRIETEDEAAALLADIESLNVQEKSPVSIQEFWQQSVSASVLSDYAEGRVNNV